MARQPDGKKGGGKLVRTETVTVRLDPKLRYLAELAARKQRRTLSSFIEWAIEQSLESVSIKNVKENEPSNLSRIADSLWSVGPPERLLKLASKCPELLNYKEQRMWKLIDEWGAFWDLDEKNNRRFRMELLNRLWGELEQYGNEDITDEDLEKKVAINIQKLGLPFNTAAIGSQPRFIDQ